MPQNSFNLRALLVAAFSTLDDAVIAAVVIFLVSRFVSVPLWGIVVVALLLLGWTGVKYLALTRNPEFGFENMAGASGITLSSLSPKGTIRIGHQQWAAKARDGDIEAGIAVSVVGQHGLLMIVVRKGQPVDAVTPHIPPIFGGSVPS